MFRFNVRLKLKHYIENLNLAVAGGFGGIPDYLALYIFEVMEENSGVTSYKINFPPPPVNAFWSVTVYDKSGFVFPDVESHGINSFVAIPNKNGSFTVNLSNDHEKMNNVNIGNDWNYCVRLYEPRSEIINGEWVFPPATEVAENDAR